MIATIPSEMNFMKKKKKNENAYNTQETQLSGTLRENGYYSVVKVQFLSKVISF